MECTAGDDVTADLFLFTLGEVTFGEGKGLVKPAGLPALRGSKTACSSVSLVSTDIGETCVRGEMSRSAGETTEGRPLVDAARRRGWDGLGTSTDNGIDGSNDEVMMAGRRPSSGCASGSSIRGDAGPSIFSDDMSCIAVAGLIKPSAGVWKKVLASPRSFHRAIFKAASIFNWAKSLFGMSGIMCNGSNSYKTQSVCATTVNLYVRILRLL